MSGMMAFVKDFAEGFVWGTLFFWKTFGPGLLLAGGVFFLVKLT